MSSRPEPDEVARELTVVSNGVTVVTLASFATFYLVRCDEPEVRRRVADVVEHYLERWGADIRWSKDPKTALWLAAGSKRPASPRLFLERLEPDEAWEFGYHGGEQAESASQTLIEGYGRPRWQGGFGYVRMALPPQMALATPRSFVERVVETCTTLHPWHGYGGLGLIESPDVAVKQAFEPHVTLLAERFSGVEIDVPTIHLGHVRDSIKGVNWLTFLDDSWVERISGLEKLEEAEPAVVIHRYPSGIVLQAGPHPTTGDLTTGSLPPAYVRVARALARIRVKGHPSFHMAGEQPRMHDERAQAWLNRFD